MKNIKKIVLDGERLSIKDIEIILSSDDVLTEVSKKSLEKMGGSIGFASVEGEGTTFAVALPIANK